VNPPEPIDFNPHFTKTFMSSLREGNDFDDDSDENIQADDIAMTIKANPSSTILAAN